MVVPRTLEFQRAEDDLGRALVAMIGGTRPNVSTAMVYSFLANRFDITADEVVVRRHEPEDFHMRFWHSADRDHVLEARGGGHLLPLVWYPWRRTSGAVADAFHFKAVVALSRVPAHARNLATAQIVLGRSCCEVSLSEFRDTPEDDDREFFVEAWC